MGFRAAQARREEEHNHREVEEDCGRGSPQHVHVRAPDQRLTVNQTGRETAGCTSCGRAKHVCNTWWLLCVCVRARLRVPLTTYCSWCKQHKGHG